MTFSTATELEHRAAQGARAAVVGLVVNTLLALIKLVAGLVGHSYALVADAIESSADVLSSAVVWRGLHISARNADENHPFGYAKAETVAAAVVALMLLGAAVGIAIQALREIRSPHHLPAPFTLVVLLAVIVVKEILSRRVLKVAKEVESRAVEGDAWHHRSDALTSAAAAIGITVALVAGPGYEAADDWAALFAAGVIAWNGWALLRPAVADLMDRSPDRAVLNTIQATASGVPEVKWIEKILARKAGMGYFVAIHVQADPAMSLHDAHILGGKVKTAICHALPNVLGVLVHMEPFEGNGPPA